jgi:hypothetical protein
MFLACRHLEDKVETRLHSNVINLRKDESEEKNKKQKNKTKKKNTKKNKQQQHKKIKHKREQ